MFITKKKHIKEVKKLERTIVDLVQDLDEKDLTIRQLENLITELKAPKKEKVVAVKTTGKDLEKTVKKATKQKNNM